MLVNATVRVPVSRDFVLVGAGRNLTGQEYADPAPGEHRQASIPQNGRTFRLGLSGASGVK